MVASMGLFRRKRRTHLIPIHPHNVGSKDWLILLEAGTIVGPSPENLRVAQATQERKVVMKREGILERRPFLTGIPPQRLRPAASRDWATSFRSSSTRASSGDGRGPSPGRPLWKHRGPGQTERQGRYRRDHGRSIGANDWGIASVVNEYDPRIHAVYFCPQLYRYDSDKKLVPLPGKKSAS